MSERLRHLEAAEQYLTGGADPNGIVNAAEGTPFWDNVNDELYYNTDGVTTWQIIGGGGGGPALPHNILSVTHSDTTPAAVVRGDLATGQGIAPTTWTRLPLGGVGQAVVSDGADVVWGAPAVAAHNLLSATHGDTVVNAATRGSLVYGNATPAWDELTLGGIAGSVLTRNATDALWSAYALAGTAAQTYTFPGATASIPGGTGAANQVAYWSGIDSLTGDVGLTWNSAGKFLTIENTADISAILIQSTDDYSILRGSRQNAGTTAPIAGNQLVRFGGSGYDGAAWAESAASFEVYAAETFTNVRRGAYLEFRTTPIGSIVLTRRATIRDEGQFLLSAGTTYTDGLIEVRGNSGTYTDDVDTYDVIATLRETGLEGIRIASESVTHNVIIASTYTSGALIFGTRTGGVNYERARITDIGRLGVGTIVPDRLLHSEVADAVTNTIIYGTRTSHTTSGAAAALFGVGHEDELEDAAGNMQVASDQVTLWATPTSAAESPLYRVTTYPAGTAGPGYSGHWTWRALSNTARTVIPNGAGDVTATMTLLFAISESGGGTAGGMQTCANSSAVNLYDDGTDIFTLTIAADGSVTIARSAGASTADVSLWMTWV